MSDNTANEPPAGVFIPFGSTRYIVGHPLFTIVSAAAVLFGGHSMGMMTRGDESKDTSIELAKIEVKIDMLTDRFDTIEKRQHDDETKAK